MDVREMRDLFRDKKNYLRFINDMVRVSLELRLYSPRGANGVEVPAVSCERHELQEVIRATKEKVEYDTLGKGYIVYVR